MKTTINLTMRDPNTGATATTVVNADVTWHALDLRNVELMADFRPVELREIVINTDRYTTLYVPDRPRAPTLIDRILQAIRRKTAELRQDFV
jgi:hypothetical protein